LVAFQLALEITLAPKEALIEELAPDGPDQALNENVRTWR